VFVRGALGYDPAMLQVADPEPSVVAARSVETGAG
jgi:hypothetical protein